MSQPADGIVLYAQPDNPDCEALCELLGDLGYVDILKLDDSSLAADDHPLQAAAGRHLLLMVDTESDYESLRVLLKHWESRPVLGLITSPSETVDERIIRACDESEYWPCSRQVLAFRLLQSRAQGFSSGSQCQFTRLKIIGQSSAFRNVLQSIERVKNCDAPVYIQGETGTGKELIARAVHYLGSRSDRPFIAVNCGAIPDQLIENELFGHHKGAYTDARESRRGVIAQAEGGTLFLDEIETLSQKGQVTLLRFIENLTYRPLGSQHEINADVRIITATNQALESLVEAAEFRSDLYYRINIIAIDLPPLRERGGDVALLAEHFMQQFRLRYQQPDKALDEDSQRALGYHDWPGNVRELQNLLHREFLMAEDNSVHLDSILDHYRERRISQGDRRLQALFAQPLREAKRKIVADFEQSYLRQLLAGARGNISRAARLAGKERRSFTRLLEKYHL